MRARSLQHCSGPTCGALIRLRPKAASGPYRPAIQTNGLALVVAHVFRRLLGVATIRAAAQHLRVGLNVLTGAAVSLQCLDVVELEASTWDVVELHQPAAHGAVGVPAPDLQAAGL